MVRARATRTRDALVRAARADVRLPPALDGCRDRLDCSAGEAVPASLRRPLEGLRAIGR